MVITGDVVGITQNGRRIEEMKKIIFVKLIINSYQSVILASTFLKYFLMIFERKEWRRREKEIWI